MRRLAVENEQVASNPHYYSTSFNGRCGFVIVKEEERCLLWITLNGGAECFTCNGLNEVFGILQREDVRKAVESECRNESAEQPFETTWQTVLAEAREECEGWDDLRPSLVPDRVLKQLAWAFDVSGKLDGERFVTILKYERVELTPAEMVELASELTNSTRGPSFKIHPN